MIHNDGLKTNDYISKFQETKRKKITKLYLDWVRRFMSIEEFSEYHQISITKAKRLIYTGRSILMINESSKMQHEKNLPW